ncbi:hypothetical protein DFJ43DRAFT_108641 [Lentinula guzmanii]|uniref:SH3 domain-containing protein n=1 Tax=Lentinula guzmanii TaxID=2804957 RepID=A0AA38JRY5_9AGAR|nr:hypothetical protein DFJ43DRAFT_108641 [Lentinula guzmanii]
MYSKLFIMGIYSSSCTARNIFPVIMQKSSQFGPLLPPLAASTPVESPAESDLTKSISSDASAALIPETSTPFERPLPLAPFAVLCLEDYHSDDPIYLSFCKDEILQVVDCDSRPGWWQAERKVGGSGSCITIGWIPQAYVQPLQSKSDDWTSASGDQKDDNPSSVPEFHHTVPKALTTAALESSSVRRIQNYRVRFLGEAQPQNKTIPKVSTPIASPFSSSKSRDCWDYILSARSEAKLLTQEIGEKRSELGAPALFNGSEQFSINGGAFNAVGGDIHETSTTTNSGNTSFMNCIFNYARSRSDSRRESSATATSKFQKKNCRKRRWSITKFTHIVNHVYYHYFPAAMYYPMYYAPWFIPWCQNYAGFS